MSILSTLAAVALLFSISLSGAQAMPNVYTDDPRTEVTGHDAPWASVGMLKIPQGGWCTATLVGPNLILTASHCIMDPFGRVAKGTYTFLPNYSRGSSASAHVKQFWWGSNFPTQQNSGDWALGRLDQPLGRQFGWMGAEKASPRRLVGRQDLIAGGYSGDFQNGEVASWEKGCSFKEYLDSGTLLHNCNTSRGSSGEPIFVHDPVSGANRIVALNVAEYRNGGSKSLIGVTYSRNTANIAVPAAAFYDLLVKLKE